MLRKGRNKALDIRYKCLMWMFGLVVMTLVVALTPPLENLDWNPDSAQQLDAALSEAAGDGS